ncbi:MAG: LysM peptidoglycan-binding domain-containing protein [Tannerella sp.]|jgi:membrane-bound lytic murein transglycosylase D|nr:LysM peptidoglycan-binding domain-containing protein [Tannerella sp.]
MNITRKTTLLLSFTLCLATTVSAQNETPPPDEAYSELSSDSTYATIGMMPEVLDENVEKLLQSWHVQYFSQTDKHCLDDDENVFFTDAVYQQRLEKLPCIIPMDYNPTVRKCIDLYAGRRRALVRYMMGMADLYFPVFEQILDRYDLPDELKYLAVVESALKPDALSRVGATGLWQFMLPTAKVYGLEINSLIDERLDPVKATHAACRYFKEMYAVYGDWHLVLAAYNCGPGNVNRAIRRAGGKTNFWEIFPYLPRETRSYIPLFIAAAYIMNYHCEHNLCPIRTSLSLASDTVMVNRMLHMRQVADVLKIDIEMIRLLNPQYKREIIPGNIMPSPLKLPVAATLTFIDNVDSVGAYRIEELLAGCETVDASGDAQDNPRKETITHTVEAGETLYTIANRYGVTAKDIRKWNKLRANRVPKGRKLTVIIDNGGITYAARGEQEPSGEESKTDAAPVVAKQTVRNTSPSPAKEVSVAANVDGVISYKVKSGDSLYSISKKYPGVTVSMIREANRMSGSVIKPGQILKIPAGGS